MRTHPSHLKQIHMVWKSPHVTYLWASVLGKIVRPGDFVMLEGSLGAGKTHFIKGLAHGLGVSKEEEVKSPSFSLIHHHQGRLELYHVDLYRLEQASDLTEIGFAEIANQQAVVAVEWLSKFPSHIPSEYIHISLEKGQTKNQRLVHIQAQGKQAETRLDQWIHAGSHVRRLTK